MLLGMVTGRTTSFASSRRVTIRLSGPERAHGSVLMILILLRLRSVIALQLGDAVLVHAQEVGACGVRALVVAQLADLPGVQTTQPGAYGGERRLVVAGHRQVLGRRGLGPRLRGRGGLRRRLVGRFAGRLGLGG